MIRPSVCIVTYKRPNLLRRLLSSLQAQDLATIGRFEVIVIDNDAEGTARSVCESFGSLGVRYAIEPERGIARARNRSVVMATGDAVVFIDDDERASPTWLRTLCEAAERYGAEIVSGPVVPEYLPLTPSWVLRCEIHDRARYASGARVTAMRTGNILIAKRALERYENPFDEKLGLSGGEDRELIARLMHNR